MSTFAACGAPSEVGIPGNISFNNQNSEPNRDMFTFLLGYVSLNLIKYAIIVVTFIFYNKQIKVRLDCQRLPRLPNSEASALYM